MTRRTVSLERCRALTADARAALRMIREVVEQNAPPGSGPDRGHSERCRGSGPKARSSRAPSQWRMNLLGARARPGMGAEASLTKSLRRMPSLGTEKEIGAPKGAPVLFIPSLFS